MHFYMLNLFVILLYVYVTSNSIFHEGSKVTFSPDQPATYFGYTVVLTSEGLLVGAPKAENRASPPLASGLVFNCPLKDNISTVTCTPLLETDNEDLNNILTLSINDSWFGSVITPLTGDKILICGYRWALMDENNDNALGKCVIRRKHYKSQTFTPLFGPYKLLTNTHTQHPMYPVYKEIMRYYFYNLAGMSAKAIRNDTFIISAPGAIYRTGSIVEYRYSPDAKSGRYSMRPPTRPIIARNFHEDEYFGYSIEAGVFDDSGKTLFVGGAPRANLGYGKVLMHEPLSDENELIIRNTIMGPQMGAYFGASLCCTDINGDGTTDILVGAPTFVLQDGNRPYDQGAVFVYTTRRKGRHFSIDKNTFVTGSKAYRARFGTTIADLQDLDGDGFNDIAIGAPWEDEGSGAVYIYRGSAAGLKKFYTQRLTAEGAGAFGISISKGLDVDANKCNDFAVGAHNSVTVYLYHCVPTVHVKVKIKVPEAMSLSQNTTEFTAYFCVYVTSTVERHHATLSLKAVIAIDPNKNRASIDGDSEYTRTIKPGTDNCDKQQVHLKPGADLSTPISIKFVISDANPVNENSKIFPRDAVRISEDSKLHASFLIQLRRDCGKDLICAPWLIMSLEPLDSPFIPGTSSKLGATLRVYNKGEPGYGAKVNITLSLPPKRIPGECSLYQSNLTCDVPAPLLRNEEFVLVIEFDYSVNDSHERNITMIAELEDHIYYTNITDEYVKEISLAIVPQASFALNGDPKPNATIQISRENFDSGEMILFTHYFAVKNFGPSDWFDLEVHISLPDKVNLSKPITGCVQTDSVIACEWSIPARVTKVVPIYLKFDLASNADILNENPTLNATTVLTLLNVKQNISRLEVVTTLILAPAPPIVQNKIFLTVIGLVAGFILLAVVTSLMYKYGFFSRSNNERMKQLQVPLCEDIQGTSTPSPDANESNKKKIGQKNSD